MNSCTASHCRFLEDRLHGLRRALAAPASIAFVGTMILCSPSWAQPIITVPPFVDGITPTSARVTWVTNLASSTAIKFGLTAAYSGQTAGQPGATVDHSWYLSGLKPGTTYHYQVCSASSGAETCSSDQTLTTAARVAGSQVPAVPKLPLQVPTSLPSGPFGPPFTVNAACSNLPSIITSLVSLTGSLHYIVQIPAGTTCYGQFTFPLRPNHTGWVIVRTSTPDSAFVSTNERVEERDSPLLAKLVTDALPAAWQKVGAFPSTCTLGQFAWASDVTDFALYECTNRPATSPKLITRISTQSGKGILTIPGHQLQTGDLVKVAGTKTQLEGGWKVTALTPDSIRLEGSTLVTAPVTPSGTVTRIDSWSAMPYRQSAGVPSGSCTPSEWLYRLDITPNTRAIFWCTSPGVWTQMRAMNAPDKTQMAPVQLATNASRYMFVGLEMTHVPAPNPPPASWSMAPFTQGQYGALVLLDPTNNDVIIDRCNLHGLDYPSRLAYGIVMNGANVALVGSRITRVNRWTEAVAPGTTGQESMAIFTQLGPGPGLIENNFIEAIGISVFFPNSLSSVLPPSNYTLRRNYFSHPDKYLYGSSQNTSGKNYMNRHILEIKSGKNILVENNIFDGNWMDVTAGAFILLTPRAGPSGSPLDVTAISGDTITFGGTVSFRPGMLLKFVNSSNGQNFMAEVISAPTTNSIKVRSVPGGLTVGARATILNSLNQVSDVTIRNNIFRNGPNVLWMTGHDNQSNLPTTLTTSRVSFTNNLMYGINALSVALGGRNSPLSISETGRSGIVAFAALGMEDLTLRNNTVGDFKGIAPTFLFGEGTTNGASGGLDVRDNIFVAEATSTGPIGNSVSGASRGAPGLNSQWQESANPVWTFGNNALCCAAPKLATNVAPGNTWLSTITDIGFASAATGDYTLTPSSKIAAGAVCPTLPSITCSSDGKAVGVDMDALKTATGKVTTGRN